MVLPFQPITVTFSDLHYFVPLPEVRPCNITIIQKVGGENFCEIRN